MFNAELTDQRWIVAQRQTQNNCWLYKQGGSLSHRILQGKEGKPVGILPQKFVTLSIFFLNRHFYFLKEKISYLKQNVQIKMKSFS